MVVTQARAPREPIDEPERCIGLTIRKGQAEGRIVPPQQRRDLLPDGKKITSPSEFFPGGRTTTETYSMTDGVSDADFDEVIR